MTKPYFISEELEPFAGMIIGRCFARVEWEEQHGDAPGVEDECRKMWYAVDALNKLSIITGRDRGNVGAVHFSIAAMNEMGRVSRYIESKIGIAPLDTPGWGWNK